MRYIILLLLALTTLCAHAAVYVRVEANGDMTYSDTPLPNSQKLDVSEDHAPIKTSAADEKVSNETTTITTESTTETEKKVVPYTQFSIKSPANNTTFQNQPLIPVDISITPQLQEGDKIQIYVDNKLQGKPIRNTHFELSIMERGSHEIYAEIINASGASIKQTDAITIYVHRAHLGGGA